MELTGCQRSHEVYLNVTTRDLCKTPLFAQFLCQDAHPANGGAQILILDFRSRVKLISCALSFFFLMGCSTKYIVTSDEYPQYAGEINQHTRLIRARRNRIFRILIHEDTFKTICPQDTIVTHDPPLPYQVGTNVNTLIDHIFKLKWRSQVMALIPNEKIQLQFLDGFFAGGTEIWELEPENGFTRTTHTIIIRPQGFIKKLIWRLKVRRKHDRMTEALLDDLKHMAETE